MKEFPRGCKRVLDKGFVSLVDSMGDDQSIVRSARVSIAGEGIRAVSQDRGLIRYLMRHRHSTPLESVQFTFHVKCPIFIARQWMRHRTWCLSGDTQLYFDLPEGIRRRRSQLTKMSVQEIFRKFQPTTASIRLDRQGYPYYRRDRIQRMLLRCLNEDTNSLGWTNIEDIWESGERDVYEVVLENGDCIKTSKDHLFLTSDGWLPLCKAANLPFNNTGNWSSNVKGFMVLCKSNKNIPAPYHSMVIRSGIRAEIVPIKLIKYHGKEMTYDLSVKGPWHNFCANGFVVHNSYNEVSARYSVLPDEFYIPRLCDIKKQAGKNKQGRSEEGYSAVEAQMIRDQMIIMSEQAFLVYKEFIEKGVARELARAILPVNTYTEFYGSVNLHNLFHFLSLRLDPHAQYEIRVYAEAIADIIKSKVPLAWEAFEDFRINGAYFTSTEKDMLLDLMPINLEEHLDQSIKERNWKTKREKTEAVEKFKRLFDE